MSRPSRIAWARVDMKNPSTTFSACETFRSAHSAAAAGRTKLSTIRMIDMTTIISTIVNADRRVMALARVL